MDNVKEILGKILAFRFVILFALGLIFPVAGWLWGKSVMGNAITTRTKALDVSLADINKLASGQHANNKWISNTTNKLNTTKTYLNAAWGAIYEKQETIFQWSIPEVGQAIAQLGPEDELPEAIAQQYALHYEDVIVPQLSDYLANTLLRKNDQGEPILQLTNENALLAYRANLGQTPGTEQIKVAQEDLWLLSLMLGIIERANANATSSFDAAVKEIRALQIGGNRITSGEEKTTTSGGQGGQGGQGMGGQGGQGGQGMGGQGGQGGQGMGGQGGQGGMTPGQGGGMQLSGGSDDEEGSEDAERYELQTDQFNRLEFRLVLLIDHQQLPVLLTEMVNDPSVIEITNLNLQGPDYLENGSGNGNLDVNSVDIGLLQLRGRIYLFNSPDKPIAIATSQPSTTDENTDETAAQADSNEEETE